MQVAQLGRYAVQQGAIDADCSVLAAAHAGPRATK